MAEVRVTIPTMLAALVHGDRKFTVEGADLGAVVDALFARHPELQVHLLDEGGNLRPHVMFFHNEVGTRELHGPVHDGDTLTVLQAVSGG